MIDNGFQEDKHKSFEYEDEKNKKIEEDIQRIKDMPNESLYILNKEFFNSPYFTEE